MMDRWPLESRPVVVVVIVAIFFSYLTTQVLAHHLSGFVVGNFNVSSAWNGSFGKMVA